MFATQSSDTFADHASESLADAPLPSSFFLSLAVTDAEVIQALGEHSAGKPRDQFALTCLKVGALALRAAKGTVDGDSIRNAGDHLISQLTERLTAYRSGLEENVTNTLGRYFDPKSGLFTSRVEGLTSDNGDLNRILKGQVQGVQQEMTQTFERFLGENSSFLSLLAPTESNQLLTAMRKTVNDVMQTEKTAIIGQFSLDDPASALSRLVRELTDSHGSLTSALSVKMSEVVGEFSLDRKDSALSRLVGRVENAQTSITEQFSLDNANSALSRLRNEVHLQIGTLSDAQNLFHKEVVGMLSAMTAKKAAEAKSTTHGVVFEEAVGDRLRAIGMPAGDIVEDCGTSTGLIRASKVGDFVLTLPPESAAAGARIVIEAKESGSYSVKSTLEEADEARRNRGAGICLFVHSARTAPVGLEPLSKFGNDIVIIWNAEDPSSDVIFKAGYVMAKALSIRAAHRSGKDAASFDVIDKAIEGVRKSMSGFDEMKTSAETIQNGATKIIDRVRIMRGEIDRQVTLLGEQIVALKESSVAGVSGAPGVPSVKADELW